MLQEILTVIIGVESVHGFRYLVQAMDEVCRQEPLCNRLIDGCRYKAFHLW